MKLLKNKVEALVKSSLNYIQAHNQGELSGLDEPPFVPSKN